MEDRKFLGTGMKFPPQINIATGRFVVSTQEQSVKESIYLILMTQKTERFIRPDFGSTVMSYTFMDVNATSINMLIHTLASEITMQEPRVKDVQITIDSETRKGCLIVNVGYTIQESNVRDNLVFPFYLNVVDEEEEESDEYGEEFMEEVEN